MKHPFFCSLLSLLFLSGLCQSQTWTNLGSEGFSPGPSFYTAIALDRSGTPYVAFEDSVNGEKTTVMKFNGTDWVVVGSPGFSAGQATSISLAIDTGGIPYVAYSDQANGGKVSVMKFNGAAWVNVGSPGFSAYVSQYVSLAIDKNNTPYMGYLGDGAIVMKFDGINWINVGAPGFSAGNTLYNKIALDTSGLPWMIYQDFANGLKASVMKYNGSNWVTVGSPGFSFVAQTQYTTIAFGPDGTPYVAYTDGYDGSATVKKFDGTSWILVGTPAGNADWTSIAIDNAGNPYLSYVDVLLGHKATVLKYNGATWDTLGIRGFSAGWAWYLNMAVDGSGNPYVAFLDATDGDKTTVMRFKNAATEVKNSTTQSAILSLFPNPGFGDFTCIVSAPANEKVTIIITNVTGEKVSEYRTTTNIKTQMKPDICPGLYFVTALVSNEKLVSNMVMK